MLWRRLEGNAAFRSGPGAGEGGTAMPRARSLRTRAALRALCAAWWLAACGGGGGGGGAAPSGSPAAAAPQSSSVTLAWVGANGPVAGYSVYVQRGGDGPFNHEVDVTQPSATLHGAPGSSARVIVVAFDAASTYG